VLGDARYGAPRARALACNRAGVIALPARSCAAAALERCRRPEP
jgi:hypothetical protein